MRLERLGDHFGAAIGVFGLFAVLMGKFFDQTPRCVQFDLFSQRGTHVIHVQLPVEFH